MLLLKKDLMMEKIDEKQGVSQSSKLQMKQELREVSALGEQFVALKAAQAHQNDPAHRAVHHRLEEELTSAIASLLDASSTTDAALAMGGVGHIHGAVTDPAMIRDMRQALEAAGEGNVIGEFLSDVAGKKLRDACEARQIKRLKAILAERKSWPKYMAMAFCDMANYDGETALFIAAKKGFEEGIAVLLQAQANPSIATAEMKTALHVAPAASTAQLLIQGGANLLALDQLGRTPFDVHKGAFPYTP